jgi:hypothetical protein
MDQFSAQPAGGNARVGQIHPQNGIVLLHVRAEEQKGSAVQAKLEPRQIAGVVMIKTVRRGDDVTAAVEHGEGVAVLERAQSPLLERDVRFDVKWRGAGFAGPNRDRAGRAEIALLLRQRPPPLWPRPSNPKSRPRRLAR